MPSTSPLLHFVIEPELLGRVEDFRFEHRFGSRAAAIKWLIAAALDSGMTPDLTNRDTDDKFIPTASRAGKRR